MSTRKRSFLTVIDVLVSAGAAVIIFAAWAKLTHQAFADIMLTIGMWTETGIFLVYAYIEWIKPKKHDEDEEEPPLGYELEEGEIYESVNRRNILAAINFLNNLRL